MCRTALCALGSCLGSRVEEHSGLMRGAWSARAPCMLRGTLSVKCGWATPDAALTGDLDQSHQGLVSRHRMVRRTLITFLYHESSFRQHGAVAQRRNLDFFLREGVAPALHNPRYHFAMVLTSPCVTPRLPTGASSSRLTIHDLHGSQGYELYNFKRFIRLRWCGAAQRAGCSSPCSNVTTGASKVDVDPRAFDYFVLIPDTVRGPFLPTYVRTGFWPDLITGLLSPTVKLVGPSINCMGCDLQRRWCRSRLHSESHLLATDRVGLALLMDHWWRPTSKANDIDHNEMGSTRIMLDHAYNIASLQMFWRKHDFRDVNATQRKCAVLRRHSLRPSTNGLASCVGCHWNVTDLNPIEVLFVHRSISYDKIHHREVGATLAYTEMRDALADLDRVPFASATMTDERPVQVDHAPVQLTAAQSGASPLKCRVACPTAY